MASKVPFRFEIVSFDLGSPRIDDVVSFNSSVFLSDTDRSRRLVHDAMQRKDYVGRVAYVDDAAVAMAYGAACIVGHWWYDTIAQAGPVRFASPCRRPSFQRVRTRAPLDALRHLTRCSRLRRIAAARLAPTTLRRASSPRLPGDARTHQPRRLPPQSCRSERRRGSRRFVRPRRLWRQRTALHR